MAAIILPPGIVVFTISNKKSYHVDDPDRPIKQTYSVTTLTAETDLWTHFPNEK